MHNHFSQPLFVVCLVAGCGGNAVYMGGPMDAGVDASSAADSAGAADASVAEVATEAGGDAAGSGGAPNTGYKFDVFNAWLNGAFSRHEAERRQPIIDTLASLDSDVLCVAELWSDADKQALAQAAGASFPYSYYAATDWSTPVTDPTDQNGQVPEQPSTAPCAASIDKMNVALACLRDSCMGGTEHGKAGADFSECILASCASSSLLPLLTGTVEDRQCWSCLFTQLSSFEEVGFTRDQCATNVSARFAFRGASGAMVLSRHPIANPSAYVLPSTEWRNVVLRAPIQFESGLSVDYYCGMATQPITSCLTRPYTGVYGGASASPMDCASQWQAEQTLQAGRINQWVKSSSARAIVAGEFYAGQGYTDGGVQSLQEQSPVAYAALTSGLSPATPASYVPRCTFSPDTNTLVTPPGTPVTADSTWTTLILTENVSPSAVTGAGIILDEKVISLPTQDGGSILVPLSYYYGFRSWIDLKP